MLHNSEAEYMFDYIGVYHKQEWLDLNEEIEMLIRMAHMRIKKAGNPNARTPQGVSKKIYNRKGK